MTRTGHDANRQKAERVCGFLQEAVKSPNLTPYQLANPPEIVISKDQNDGNIVAL